MKDIKRIAVTGGAGHIAYSLLFRIAAGEMLGPDQPVALHLLELPNALQALEGVKMELEDCAFPLLQEIRTSSDPFEGFGDVDYAILVGAKPRGAGMERKDLLQENGQMFTIQGRALNASAKQSTIVLVVGNPCNTNCLIALSHAPRIPPTNFHAMTRLDQNRAKALLAKRAATEVTAVTQLIIWGNHSSTQVPDFTHAYIHGKLAAEVIGDLQWLQKDFFSLVQKRGAEVIQARGKSSAASAASAAIDAIRALAHPNSRANKECFSSGVYSAGNPYGIDPELIFSFPCQSTPERGYEILPGFSWDSFLEAKIRETERELQEERQLIAHLLKRDPL